MENKHNFMGIIIPVVIAVILLTVLPIINSMNVECPPCENIPTLYTPTISISDDTLTITPNSNNGAFVTGYKIYVDNVLLDTTTSITYDLSEKLTEIGTYEIYVTAYATLFSDSNPSNVDEYVVEPISTGPKAFEVGEIIPATTQLKIRFIPNPDYQYGLVLSDNYNFIILEWTIVIVEGELDETSYLKINNENKDFSMLEENTYIIDTSNWSLAERTIIDTDNTLNVVTWEDLNA